MATVYIIEDEIIIAAGFQAEFHSASCPVKVSGFTSKIDDAIQAIREHSCDVIILDLFLRKEDPIGSFNRLHKNLPTIPVIIYTKENSLLWKWRMILEGVSGYVVKGWDVEELKDTICRVAEGQVVYPIELVIFLERKKFPKGIDAVKPRDLDIIRMRDCGYLNREIAMKYGISEKAVEQQLRRLCELLGFESVKEIIKRLCRTNDSELKY